MILTQKTTRVTFSSLKKSVIGELFNQVRVIPGLTNHMKAYANFSTNQNAINDDEDDERVWRENWKRRCDLATAYRGLAK